MIETTQPIDCNELTKALSMLAGKPIGLNIVKLGKMLGGGKKIISSHKIPWWKLLFFDVAIVVDNHCFSDEELKQAIEGVKWKQKRPFTCCTK